MIHPWLPPHRASVQHETRHRTRHKQTKKLRVRRPSVRQEEATHLVTLLQYLMTMRRVRMQQAAGTFPWQHSQPKRCKSTNYKTTQKTTKSCHTDHAAADTKGQINTGDRIWKQSKYLYFGHVSVIWCSATKLCWTSTQGSETTQFSIILYGFCIKGLCFLWFLSYVLISYIS